ncbi:hypothetical protein MKW92_013714 [Papaver armeniacum]|nr:hypothetical protein MKW92_013714 [Papaver armeniacum]
MQTTKNEQARITKTVSRTRAYWQSRLGAAFRTALACTIIGFVTLFSPVVLQKEVAFPALSYVTVILVVTEATLGYTVQGCWHALFATCQGAVPAFLILWLVGPARHSITASVLAVTFTSFAVMLPESTHLICKRIALAQIVILYSVTSVKGVHTKVFMHPVHVAASTGVGTFAALLALVFPYPRLASYEVRKNCLVFKENFSRRLNLFVNAFCAENKTSALASLSQAKSLGRTGTTVIQNIKIKEKSMQWEKPLNKLTKQYDMNPTDRFQALEIPLKGIELALISSTSFPIRVVDQELKSLLFTLKEQTNLHLNQASQASPSCTSTVPETSGKEVLPKLFLQPPHTINFLTRNDLPSFFFLFCMKLLHDESMISQSADSTNKPETNTQESMQKQYQCTKKLFMISNLFSRISTKRLIYAAKCSASLGLAVLFGMIFNKENGFWAGLTVGVGMAGGREATYKIANNKAQGTVLGTIYGLLACYVFTGHLVFRFLSLIPWIMFASFLRRSRMYDQAGAVSAVIAALIMLGRKNYGPPSEFAIVRITEAFIGLSCSIMLEILLQPTRASTMARGGISKSLKLLYQFVESIDFCIDSGNKSKMFLKELNEKENKLRDSINELRNFIAEAGVEPNFWFIPFHGVCYGKLLGSLSKMVDVMHFATQAIGLIVQESHKFGATWVIGEDLDLFKKVVNSSVQCFEKVTSLESLEKLEKELESKNISCDVESGKSAAIGSEFNVLISENEEALEKVLSSFVKHTRELVDEAHSFEGDDRDKIKSQMVLCLSALGFWIDCLMKETREMEKSVQELVQWDNPTSHINMSEIYFKINALHTHNKEQNTVFD